MDLIIDYPLFYNFLCLLVGFSFSAFLYLFQNNLIKKSVTRILFTLRWIFISFLCFLLLDPLVRSFHKELEEQIVIFAQDCSSSIQEDVVYQLDTLKSELEGYNIYEFSFSDNVSLGFSTINNGDRTDINNMINDMENRFENQIVKGLIIASDGIYNTGKNPLYRNDFDFPIYSIALGDTTVKKDLRILKVKHNDISFLGNTFPVEISLSAEEVEGYNTRLTISNNNKELYSENIQFATNEEYYKVKVFLEASQLGVQKYEIKTTVIDGEENIINNHYVAHIEIVESSYNILILQSKSHPDIAFYKNSIESNQNYNIEVYDIDNFYKEINHYNLLVLCGLEEHHGLIKDIENSEIPVLIFSLGDYNLVEYLTKAVNFTGNKEIEEVFAVKNDQFSKFILSDGLISFINSAPPLSSSFVNYKFVKPVEFILQQQINNYIIDKPIIGLCEDSRKIAFVNCEGFWRWRLHEYSSNESHKLSNEIFNKLTQYLILQKNTDRFRIDYNKQFFEDEDVSFEAFLFNESYESVPGEDINLTIIDEKDLRYDFQFSKSDDYYSLLVGKLSAGQYTFVAKVEGKEFVKEGKFDVKPVQLEELNLVANHTLLYDLAKNSNGKVYSINEIDGIISEFNNKQQKDIFSIKETLQGIINIPWILLILLVLISVEWFARKYNGQV